MKQSKAMITKAYDALQVPLAVPIPTVNGTTGVRVCGCAGVRGPKLYPAYGSSGIRDILDTPSSRKYCKGGGGLRDPSGERMTDFFRRLVSSSLLRLTLSLLVCERQGSRKMKQTSFLCLSGLAGSALAFVPSTNVVPSSAWTSRSARWDFWTCFPPPAVLCLAPRLPPLHRRRRFRFASGCEEEVVAQRSFCVGVSDCWRQVKMPEKRSSVQPTGSLLPPSLAPNS